MAVVFISPKERQKMFIIGITAVVGLILVVIAVMVFFSQPKKDVTNELTFNKPKVSIKFDVFDLEQFKSLQLFEDMKIQFVYKASKDGKSKDGYIAATSVEDAKAMLEELGYSVSDIKEAEIGRENPFESYKIEQTTTSGQTSENTETTETSESGSTETGEPNYLQ